MLRGVTEFETSHRDLSSVAGRRQSWWVYAGWPCCEASHQVRPELCGGSQAIMVEKKEKKAGAGGGGMNSMGMNPYGMPAGLTM